MANRFLVLWDKKIENGIAPPQFPGWCCDRLEEEDIEAVGEFILSPGVCQIPADLPS